MEKLLGTGTLLERQFRIIDVLGHGEETAAYLALDLDHGGAWTLVWESLEMFQLRQKPQGALKYMSQDERHYLILRLEGQDLGLVYGAAGVVVGDWAALWMAQVCEEIGHWHTRKEKPLICLEVGDIRLADLRLMASGRAILPSRDLLSQPVKAIVAGQSLAFSAPEKYLEEPLTARSDVYALGAVLYCLVTGTPPPSPSALVDGQAELVPPRKVQRSLSGRLEKSIRKAMSLNPDHRYESAMQFSFELGRCVPRRLRRYKIGVI